MDIRDKGGRPQLFIELVDEVRHQMLHRENTLLEIKSNPQNCDKLKL